MTSNAMALVLLAALLHAIWNAVVKSSPDKFLDIVLVTASAAALSAVALPFLHAPALSSWPYLAASGAIHVVYFVLVGAIYRRGDMSYAYPLMRGAPPLLIALASGPLIHEHLSTAGWSGVLLICGGILAMTFANHRSQGATSAATALALVNAGVVAAYTLVDGVGARLAGDPVAYTMWVFLLTAPVIVARALLRRRTELESHFRRRWRFALIGGASSVGAYSLVLWAMTQAPVAMVAALREAAILFGMALSALVLKERFGWSRYVAAAVIMTGVVVLRLT